MSKRKRVSPKSLKASKKPRVITTTKTQSLVLSRPLMGSTRVPADLTALRAEVKALDTVGGTFAINTTGTILPLNLIRAGASFFNRIGRRVELKSLMIKTNIVPLRTAAVQDYLRMAIIYDRQTNGANPTLQDIFQTTDQAGANTLSVFSDINLNNRDRFHIFFDKRIVLPSLNVAAGVITQLGPADPIQPWVNVFKFIKLKGEVTQFKADSAPAVVGDIATGGLFFVSYGSQAAAAEGWQGNVETRLRYNDHA